MDKIVRRGELKDLFDFIQGIELGRLYFSHPEGKLHRYTHCINSRFYMNVKTIEQLEKLVLNGRLCTKCFGSRLEEVLKED